MEREQMRSVAAKKVSSYIVLIALLLVAGVAVSLFINMRTIDRDYKEIAMITARSFFQSIVVTRSWNASHGGVYVPVSDRAEPNEYLEDPMRDVTTTNGMKLTKINPAYMTRMISELLNSSNQIRFRMSSLRPLNPANVPSEWERQALEGFQIGNGEMSGIREQDGNEVFMYMGVLKVEKACLKCHAKQGYKEGDVRGGISVSSPYGPFRKAINRSDRIMVLGHLLFLFFGLLVISFMGRRLVRSVADLESTRVHVTQLEGLLPICSNCKKMRTEDGDPMDESSWVGFEKYISDRSGAEFSHGICPECAKKLYPDIFKEYSEK